MNFFKAFQIAGLLTTWLEKALVDGAIDQNEIVDLIKSILSLLGVTAEIKVNTNL